MAKRIIKPVDVFVGERINARRLEIGMSQQKLADAIGLTFQQVQKYEKGINRVSSSRLVQIANVLKVPPVYFFDDPSSAQPTYNRLVSDDVVAGLSEFVSSKEGVALIKAFVTLPKDVRRSITKMVEKIADRQ